MLLAKFDIDHSRFNRPAFNRITQQLMWQKAFDYKVDESVSQILTTPCQPFIQQKRHISESDGRITHILSRCQKGTRRSVKEPGLGSTGILVYRLEGNEQVGGS